MKELYDTEASYVENLQLIVHVRDSAFPSSKDLRVP